MSSGSSEGLSTPAVASKVTTPTREELLQTREQVQRLLDRLPIDKPSTSISAKPTTIANPHTSDIYDYNEEEELSEEFFENIEDPACQFTEGYIHIYFL